MTEDQAKTKWCPFARVVTAQVASEVVFHPANRAAIRYDDGRLEINDNPEHARCNGSACMAWRTSHTERGPIVERRKAEPLSRKPEGDDWGYEAIDPARSSTGGEWVRWDRDRSETHGFCGLAGAPQ